MAFERGHALVVGVGTHCFAPHINVPVTVRDAEAVADVLRDPKSCGYLNDRVHVLTEAGATRTGILRELADLAANAAVDDTVIVFFAGHGALGTDGEYYLLGHDVQLDGSRVKAGTGLNEGELLDALRKIKAKRMLLIFNACFSGNISTDSLGTGAAEPDVESSSLSLVTAQALLGTGEGRIIITACREDQKSWIGKGAPLTYFAQALGDGLRGRGPRNNGGFISAYGLYEHVYTTVKEVAWDDKRQTQEPELTVIKGVGPYAVALYRGASSLGEFDAEERVPTEGAVNEVKPEKAARVFSQHVIQSGGVNFGQNNKIDIQGDVVAGDQVAGDKIDARGAQGFINKPTGPVTQHFGTQITNYYQTASEVPESAMATWSAGARTLYGLLRDRWFDTNDLEDLTFQLNLDWDNLRGDTKMAKARALVAACESLGLTENLRRLMRLARPNLKDQLA